MTVLICAAPPLSANKPERISFGLIVLGIENTDSTPLGYPSQAGSEKVLVAWWAGFAGVCLPFPIRHR